MLTLAQALEALGLPVFVDNLEIDPDHDWVIRLSDALEHSRYLVLVLSDHTSGQYWVLWEWTSFMAGYGPMARLLPAKIDPVDLPFIFNSTQSIDATYRDARQAAAALDRGQRFRHHPSRSHQAAARGRKPCGASRRAFLPRPHSGRPAVRCPVRRGRRAESREAHRSRPPQTGHQVRTDDALLFALP